MAMSVPKALVKLDQPSKDLLRVIVTQQHLRQSPKAHLEVERALLLRKLEQV